MFQFRGRQSDNRQDSEYLEDTGYFDDGESQEEGAETAYGSEDPGDWQRAAEENRRQRAQQLRLEEEKERQEEKRRSRDRRRELKSRARKRFLQKHHRAFITLGITAGVLAALAVTVLLLYVTHTVTEVKVTGNTFHSQDEITDIVCQGPLGLGRNSLYLSWKYHNRAVEGVPFVEKMTVKITSPHAIEIRVVEKVLAGYVDYLGDYMYFTRDGTVVEASTQKVDGVPEVTGLKFSHIILGRKLPVADAGVFDRILDITQLLSKYSLTIDKIYFDASSNMTLFYGKVRVNLGQDTYTEEKIANLSQILPDLTGKNGSIDMSDFTPDTTSISFQEAGAQGGTVPDQTSAEQAGGSVETDSGSDAGADEADSGTNAGADENGGAEPQTNVSGDGGAEEQAGQEAQNAQKEAGQETQNTP